MKIWECPYCRHQISDVEYTAVKVDSGCPNCRRPVASFRSRNVEAGDRKPVSNKGEGGKVYSVAQAQNWFLANATGTVVCVRPDETEKECGSFPEADTFFGSEERQPDGDSRT